MIVYGKCLGAVTEEDKDFLCKNCKVERSGGHSWLRETILNVEHISIKVIKEGIFQEEEKKVNDIIQTASAHGFCESICHTDLTLPQGLNFGSRGQITRSDEIV